MVGVQTFLEAFLNMSLRFTSFIDKAFIWLKAKLLVLGLLFSSAGLSGFLDYWISHKIILLFLKLSHNCLFPHLL